MNKSTSEHKKLYSFEDQELRMSDLWNPLDGNQNFLTHPRNVAIERNSNASNSENNLNFKNNFNENILNLSTDTKNNLPPDENNNLNFVSSPKNMNENSLTFSLNTKNNENILNYKNHNDNTSNFRSTTRNQSNNEIFLSFKNNLNPNMNENSLNFGNNQKILNLPPSPIQPNRSLDMDSEFLKEYEDAIVDRDKKISELLNEISVLKNEKPDIDEEKQKMVDLKLEFGAKILERLDQITEDKNLKFNSPKFTKDSADLNDYTKNDLVQMLSELFFSLKADFSVLAPQIAQESNEAQKKLEENKKKEEETKLKLDENKKENLDLKIKLKENMKNLENLELEMINLHDQLITQNQQMENYKVEYNRMQNKKNEEISKLEFELQNKKIKEEDNRKTISDLKEKENHISNQINKISEEKQSIIRENHSLNIEKQSLEKKYNELLEKEKENFRKIEIMQRKFQENEKKFDSDQATIFSLKKSIEAIEKEKGAIIKEKENEKNRLIKQISMLNDHNKKIQVNLLPKILKQFYDLKLEMNKISQQTKNSINELKDVSNEYMLRIEGVYLVRVENLKKYFETKIRDMEENYIVEKTKYKEKIKSLKKEVEAAKEFKYSSYIEPPKEENKLMHYNQTVDSSFLKCDNEDFRRNFNLTEKISFNPYSPNINNKCSPDRKKKSLFDAAIQTEWVQVQSPSVLTMTPTLKKTHERTDSYLKMKETVAVNKNIDMLNEKILQMGNDYKIFLSLYSQNLKENFQKTGKEDLLLSHILKLQEKLDASLEKDKLLRETKNNNSSHIAKENCLKQINASQNGSESTVSDEDVGHFKKENNKLREKIKKLEAELKGKEKAINLLEVEKNCLENKLKENEIAIVSKENENIFRFKTSRLDHSNKKEKGKINLDDDSTPEKLENPILKILRTNPKSLVCNPSSATTAINNSNNNNNNVGMNKNNLQNSTTLEMIKKIFEKKK